MYVPSVSQDLSEAAPGVVFGLLIIVLMFVAPTGLAGLPGRVRAGVTRRPPRTTDALDRTPEAVSVPEAEPAPDAVPKSQAASGPSAPHTAADPAVVDAEPVGAPPRTEKE